MGIFNKIFPFTKRKTQVESNFIADSSSFTDSDTDTALDEMEKETLQKDKKKTDYDSKTDPRSFITDNCEQILETTRQLEELKIEYQAVTSYLADIQKIERLPEEDRKEINDTAKKVITYTNERINYQNRARKITDVQFKNIARYEDILPDELKKMKDNEAYYDTIKTDMKYLESEKNGLIRQRDDIIYRQDYLKKVAVVTCVLVLILFSVFALLENTTKSDMKLPFLLTIAMAGISAFYIFINSVSNRKEMKITELKLNRAIGLLNKVKIKYINKTNELDYAYQKHMVKSHAELEFLWEQYQKTKEEENTYNKNMEDLEYYKRYLIKVLRSFDLYDPDIWEHQITALVDNKEMDEVKHRLENRRKKLRERIDYNNSLKDKSLQQLQNFIEKRPEKREEIAEKLKVYGIYL